MECPIILVLVFLPYFIKPLYFLLECTYVLLYILFEWRYFSFEIFFSPYQDLPKVLTWLSRIWVWDPYFRVLFNLTKWPKESLHIDEVFRTSLAQYIQAGCATNSMWYVKLCLPAPSHAGKIHSEYVISQAYALLITTIKTIFCLI